MTTQYFDVAIVGAGARVSPQRLASKNVSGICLWS